MYSVENRTALVTGANSGLGFETAALLAESGYGKVVVTARTQSKADEARRRLVERTDKDVFVTSVMDFDSLATIEPAVADLTADESKFDVLMLNAGIAPPSDARFTKDGLEATMAASLVGHHLLTMRLLEQGIVNENARIVIAGSEAARGDVPMFRPIGIDEFAKEEFDGDLDSAIESVMKLTAPATYKSGNQYATAKQFVAWWAAELSKLVPAGTTVNAVSPGSTPGTNADRHVNFVMKHVMMPILKIIPGMSHSIADGASRYLEAVSFGDDVTGKFFASPPKKMTGPLTEMKYEHLDRPEAQKALWQVTTKVAGGVDFPISQ